MMKNRIINTLSDCVQHLYHALNCRRASRFALIFALGFASCVKLHLYETDHPDHGQIKLLNLDWSNRGEGVDMPDEYTFSSEHSTTEHAHTATMSAEISTVEHHFPAGQHQITVHSTADNITVDIQQNTATANYSAGEPGWFFSGSATANIERDKEHAVSVPMQQRVRELRLELKIEGSARSHITAIEANLSGIAQTISLTNGQPMGGSVNVVPLFSVPDCSNPAYCLSTASLRLLGIIGSGQTLSLTLHFDDGRTITLESSLSEQLRNFNDNRKTPLILQNSLTVGGSEFTATINQWVNNNSGDLIAD